MATTLGGWVGVASTRERKSLTEPTVTPAGQGQALSMVLNHCGWWGQAVLAMPGLGGCLPTSFQES
jgi:hypothetical protein